MSFRRPTAAIAGGPAGDDVVVLVTSDRDGASCLPVQEVRRHIRFRGGIDALVLPLNARAPARLAAGLPCPHGRAVFVPIAFSASDALLTDLAGLLRSAKARLPEAVLLQGDPLAAPEHVVGWVIRQVRMTLAARPAMTDALERTAVILMGSSEGPAAANAEVCAIARLVWEREDYGSVTPAFLDDRAPRPSLIDLIRAARDRGMRRVVIVQCTLLHGVQRDPLDRLDAGLHRDVEVFVAGPLLTPGAAAAIVLERHRDAVARWLAFGDDGLVPGHGHAHETDAPPQADALLPPRYRQGRRASATPMRSAPLRYDDEGRVAWDEVWQSFCDLALAGGPPHRGTLLEPALKEDVLEDPRGYARVVAEISRGLSLVTRLPVVADAAPGWVGMVCPDEEMAIWLLRAITVENVSVRREGAMLLLPAGPRYQVEKEIKNVITAVAKTHHYWMEHRTAR